MASSLACVEDRRKGGKGREDRALPSRAWHVRSFRASRARFFHFPSPSDAYHVGYFLFKDCNSFAHVYFCSLSSVVRPRMADHIRRVLTGDVTDLPRKESNIVRIFTSSTFTGIYYCQPSKMTMKFNIGRCWETINQFW